MHFAFIDDSQQQNPQREGLGHLVSLGAAIVPEESLRPYSAALAEIRKDLSIPDGEEIKWKPPKGSFLANAGAAVVLELRQRMLQEAIDHGIRTVVMMIDHESVYSYDSIGEVGKTLLEWVYERITMHLASTGQNCVIIADKPGGGSAEEKKWLSDTLALTSDGTTYVKPGAVVLPIVTAVSDHVPHLQLADLITAATTAAMAERQSGITLAPLLRQLFIRNHFNAAGNVGIKILPGHLNLYHWVFGETYVSRGGEILALPIPGLYYADSGTLSGPFSSGLTAPRLT